MLNDGKGNEYLLEVAPRNRKHKAITLDLYAVERCGCWKCEGTGLNENRPDGKCWHCGGTGIQKGKNGLKRTRKVESLAIHVSDRSGNLQWTT